MGGGGCRGLLRKKEWSGDRKESVGDKGEEPQDRGTEQGWGRAPQQLQSEEHLSDLIIGRENQSGIGEILLF